jgi:hypothetical protein
VHLCRGEGVCSVPSEPELRSGRDGCTIRPFLRSRTTLRLHTGFDGCGFIGDALEDGCWRGK